MKLQGQGFNVRHHNMVMKNNWSGRAGNVKNYGGPPIKGFCERVFVQIYVKPSGIVSSCVNDFYDTNIMGDVNESTLQDIWFGSRFETLRRNLIKKDRSCSELCANCDYQGYNGYFRFQGFRKWGWHVLIILNKTWPLKQIKNWRS